MKLPEVRWEWVAKMPPMPEKDAEELDLLRYSHPPGSGVIIDSNPRAWKSPVCIICGTWICSECWEFRRTYAIRSQHQSCKKCGSERGYFVAIRHHWRVPDYHDNIRQVPYVVPKINPSPITLEDIRAYAQQTELPRDSYRKETPVHVPEEAKLHPTCALTEPATLEEAEKIVGCTEEVEHDCKYPYDDGDITVLGPEIFVNKAKGIICWQGQNYGLLPDPFEACESTVDEAKREESFQRREAMDHAVKLAIADIGVGGRTYEGQSLTMAAEEILRFLKGDS